MFMALLIVGCATNTAPTHPVPKRATTVAVVATQTTVPATATAIATVVPPTATQTLVPTATYTPTPAPTQSLADSLGATRGLQVGVFAMPDSIVPNLNTAAAFENILTMNRGILNDLALNADQTNLAVAAATGLWIYDYPSLTPISHQALPSAALSIAWAPDGLRLAVGGQDGRVRVYQAVTWVEEAVLHGHVAGIETLDWSADGALLATGGNDSTVLIWDIATGAIAQRLDAHTEHLLNVAWAPDSTQLLTAGADKQAILWDATTWTYTAPKWHQGQVLASAWSPNGKYFATTDYQGDIFVWDAETEDLHKKLFYQHPDRTVTVDMVWSADGAAIAVSEVYELIRIVDVATNNIVDELWSPGGYAATLVWPENSQMIVAGSFSHDLSVWNYATGQRENRLTSNIRRWSESISWTLDETQLVSTDGDSRILVYDATTGETVETWSADTRDDFLEAVVRRPHHTEFKALDIDNFVFSYVPTQGETRPVYELPDLGLSFFTWAPDGSRYAINDVIDADTYIFDADTDEVLQVLNSAGSTIYHVAWSADSRYVAAPVFDVAVNIWDTTTGELLMSLGAELKDNTAVEWIPNTTWLAVGTRAGHIYIVDVITQTIVYHLQGHTDRIYTLSASPDGRWLASSAFDYSSRIWDTQSGFATSFLLGERNGYAIDFDWTQDSTKLALGSLDGTLQVWQVLQN